MRGGGEEGSGMTAREKILLARRAKKWTQIELAKRIRCSAERISSLETLENPHISAHVLWRVCDELELDYPELCRELRGRVEIPNQIKIDIEDRLDRKFYEKLCAMLRAKKANE